MKTLLEVVDELAIVRDLVECVFLALAEVAPEQGEPIRAVLDVASGRVTGVKEAVDQMRAIRCRLISQQRGCANVAHSQSVECFGCGFSFGEPGACASAPSDAGLSVD